MTHGHDPRKDREAKETRKEAGVEGWGGPVASEHGPCPGRVGAQRAGQPGHPGGRRAHRVRPSPPQSFATGRPAGGGRRSLHRRRHGSAWCRRAARALDVTKTRPDDDRGTALFVVGGVRVVARGRRPSTARSTMPPPASQQDHSDLRLPGDRGRHDSHGPRRGGGAVAYTSPGRVGEYAVFVADDVSGRGHGERPEHQFRGLLPTLDHSLRSVTFGGGP